MKSELYIQQAVQAEAEGKFYLSPDIPQKKLVNASTKIAQSIDSGLVVAIIDSSLFGDAKEGIVFTGDTVFIHESFADHPDLEIPLSGIDSVNYFEEDRPNEKGKSNIYKVLKVEYSDETSKPIILESKTTTLPVKTLFRILNNFNNSVDTIEASAQDVTLSDLGDETITLYFELIINYFNFDNHIDSDEYRELASIMARLDLNEVVREKLREYRFDATKFESNESIVSKLRTLIPGGSQITIFDSLMKDIISSMSSVKLKDWDQEVALTRLAAMLGVDEAKLRAFVRLTEDERRQIKERLSNSQIEQMAKEGASILTGAGVVAGSLMATSSATVLTSLFVMSTGGLGLVGLGIGAASVAAYKGVKHLTSGKGLEEYALRNKALQDRVKTLTQTQSIMLEDINYITTQITEIVRNQNAVTTKFKELEQWVNHLQSVDESAKSAEDLKNFAEREQILSTLPESLDKEKVIQLLEKQPGKEKLLQALYLSYSSDFILNDSASLGALQAADHILTAIHYEKIATVANANLIKKTVTSERFLGETKEKGRAMLGRFLGSSEDGSDD